MLITSISSIKLAWENLPRLPSQLSKLGSSLRNFQGGLATDVLAVSITYTVSDTIAQFSEQRRASDRPFSLDCLRNRKFSVFGLLDGAFDHYWYVILDKLVVGSGVLATSLRILANSTVYYATWAAWFILVTSYLQYIRDPGRNSIRATFNREWKELYLITTGY